MARRRRIHLAGVLLQIVQRGHDREPCFFGEEDYHAYLHWLGEALSKERCALHTYVLMTNHLLVTPERAESIPQVIIALGRRYVQYINTAYRRTGTQWDSRYKSSVIQAETYLLCCQRYIELKFSARRYGSMIRRITVGAVIGTMRWGKPTGMLCRVGSTWRLGQMRGRGGSPTGACSVPNWTRRLSATSAWRSTRTSRSEVHASTRRSKP